MSTPEMGDNEDNDDNTPESTANRHQQSSPLFRSAPSPGRGAIPRLNHYSNAVTRRVRKRRQRDRELGRRLRGADGGSDDDEGEDNSSDERSTSNAAASAASAAGGGDRTTPRSRFASIGDFFSLLEAHPYLPSILSWWAQLLVNLSLFSLTVYVVFGFVSAIRSEFDHAAEERSDVILAEMAACAKDYVDNQCAGGKRLPAMEAVCENWERCMNRDPAKVGRAKLSAHTMAEIINNFIDPISWKAIVGFFFFFSTPHSPSSDAYISIIITVVLLGHDLDRNRCEQLVVPLFPRSTQSFRLCSWSLRSIGRSSFASSSYSFRSTNPESFWANFPIWISAAAAPDPFSSFVIVP